MTATITERFSPAVDHLKDELAEIEMNVLTKYTLADAIREGSTVSSQSYNWGNGERACALSAACISAAARGYIK